MTTSTDEANRDAWNDTITPIHMKKGKETRNTVDVDYGDESCYDDADMDGWNDYSDGE